MRLQGLNMFAIQTSVSGDCVNRYHGVCDPSDWGVCVSWSVDHRGGGKEEALRLSDGVCGPAQLLLQGEGPGQQCYERGHQHSGGGYGLPHHLRTFNTFPDGTTGY